MLINVIIKVRPFLASSNFEVLKKRSDLLYWTFYYVVDLLLSGICQLPIDPCALEHSYHSRYLSHPVWVELQAAASLAVAAVAVLAVY